MADALSAASLLLAALALVYSAWAPSIDAAIIKDLGTTEAAIDRSKEEIRLVRNSRAWPIAISCWLILAVFVVRDIHIIGSIQCIGKQGCEYDDTAVVFLLTQTLVAGLGVHAQRQVGRLKNRL